MITKSRTGDQPRCRRRRVWVVRFPRAPAFPQHGGFDAAPAFPHQGFGAQALSVLSIIYLITSSRPDFAAYIADDPWAARVRARQDPHRGVLAAALDSKFSFYSSLFDPRGVD
jgi:hypothetical protein